MSASLSFAVNRVWVDRLWYEVDFTRSYQCCIWERAEFICDRIAVVDDAVRVLVSSFLPSSVFNNTRPIEKLSLPSKPAKKEQGQFLLNTNFSQFIFYQHYREWIKKILFPPKEFSYLSVNILFYISSSGIFRPLSYLICIARSGIFRSSVSKSMQTVCFYNWFISRDFTRQDDAILIPFHGCKWGYIRGAYPCPEIKFIFTASRESLYGHDCHLVAQASGVVKPPSDDDVIIPTINGASVCVGGTWRRPRTSGGDCGGLMADRSTVLDTLISVGHTSKETGIYTCVCLCSCVPLRIKWPGPIRE